MLAHMVDVLVGCAGIPFREQRAERRDLAASKQHRREQHDNTDEP